VWYELCSHKGKHPCVWTLLMAATPETCMSVKASAVAMKVDGDTTSLQGKVLTSISVSLGVCISPLLRR
jgi:hypothetical protein